MFTESYDKTYVVNRCHDYVFLSGFALLKVVLISIVSNFSDFLLEGILPVFQVINSDI